jgi:hypothetical protein
VGWRYNWHTMWTKILHQLQYLCSSYGCDLLVVETNECGIEYLHTPDNGDACLWPVNVTA